MTIELIPATTYTIQELTEAYNQTRVDYMVPMPMNAARLREYINIYDVDLKSSLVALDNGNIIGLGMLAVRDNRSWITRLGLVANQRGKGTGRILMTGLLKNSDALGIEKNQLEVIVGNEPAHALFKKLVFVQDPHLVESAAQVDSSKRSILVELKTILIVQVHAVQLVECQGKCHFVRGI